jgi:hypothetical protein
MELSTGDVVACLNRGIPTQKRRIAGDKSRHNDSSSDIGKARFELPFGQMAHKLLKLRPPTRSPEVDKPTDRSTDSLDLIESKSRRVNGASIDDAGD